MRLTFKKQARRFPDDFVIIKPDYQEYSARLLSHSEVASITHL